MTRAIHQNLAAGRWFGLTLSEQLGNVGSEVGRAVSWQKRNNSAYLEKALQRAFELLDLTIADPRWKTGRKELCRAREVLADVFYGDGSYHTTPEDMEKYFYQFALIARR